MTPGFVNSFLLTDDPMEIERGEKCGTSRFTVATRYPERFSGKDNIEVFKCVEKPSDVNSDALALMSLDDDKTVDAVTEQVLGKNAKLIVAASYSLSEIGKIDARFHLSPVQLLHKLGLLDRARIVGGVYLDRDDLDLMAQCGTKLILCPTASLGYGYGMPHFNAAASKVEIALGSGDNKFNGNGNMLWEARALLLGSNCDMRSATAVNAEELFKCFCSAHIADPEKLLFFD